MLFSAERNSLFSLSWNPIIFYKVHTGSPQGLESLEKPWIWKHSFMAWSILENRLAWGPWKSALKICKLAQILKFPTLYAPPPPGPPARWCPREPLRALLDHTVPGNVMQCCHLTAFSWTCSTVKYSIDMYTVVTTVPGLVISYI